MKMERITTDINEVLSIPKEDMPLMVLSDDLRSFIAWGIKHHEKGSYNHFMWAINPGKFVTQSWTFREVSMEKYLTGRHRLKFISSSWNLYQKELIVNALKDNLSQSIFRRLYDPLQIVGIWLGIKWLQIPGHSRICSDFGGILKLTDPYYNLKHPSPTEVNRYTKNRQDTYSVYLRYIPD